ncbi:universal stress protein [Rhodococcus sp. JS3073]|uniref:universal stress protein n=1 Tax=Rhodococcus sp. JS3073 TaxID=3002901 RepID=UPI003FA77378
MRHLLELADEAQLIVVGNGGRGGFAGMTLGSTSTALLHTTTCPSSSSDSAPTASTPPRSSLSSGEEGTEVLEELTRSMTLGPTSASRPRRDQLGRVVREVRRGRSGVPVPGAKVERRRQHFLQAGRPGVRLPSAPTGFVVSRLGAVSARRVRRHTHGTESGSTVNPTRSWRLPTGEALAVLEDSPVLTAPVGPVRTRINDLLGRPPVNAPPGPTTSYPREP